jgi:hypothetical protein
MSVPAGVIQNKVSWFGLQLDFGGESLFVARPGTADSRLRNTHWHVNTGDELPEMADLRLSHGRDEFLARISAKVGVGSTFVPRAGGSSEQRHLTFRSSLLYCLQKQNEIANPDLYFHRQGEAGIAQQIRDTLPYYLGAISEHTIALHEELKAKRRRLKEVERLLERRLETDSRKDREAGYLLTEAQRLGLIAVSPNQGGSEATAVLLRNAETASLSDVTLSGDGKQLSALSAQLYRLQTERSDLQKKIEALEAFQQDQLSVQEGVSEQRRRLHSLHLLPDGVETAETCPVCLSALSVPTPTTTELNKSLRRLEKELSFVASDRTEISVAIASTRDELRRVESEIETARADIRRLREEDERSRSLLETRNEAARVGGMIHMYMRVVGEGRPPDGSLQAEASALRSAIEVLEEETDYQGVQTRTATFLASVGQTITQWAQEQNLEYSSGILTFDIRGPRLISETDRGTIPFSQFGSGRNWVWYHLLGHMALHKWFIEKQRPVPRFLILDQPSQVYFPGTNQEGDEDMQEVLRIYRWLFNAMRTFDDEFQIIVMDHARFPEDTEFMSHLQHNWWQTRESLIPMDWL